MTQIAIGVAIGMIQEHEGDCWFCKEEPTSDKLKNDLDSSPDTSNSESEDNVPENDVVNNSGKLGRKLGNKPTWEITCPKHNVSTKVLPAAHHCIPGNASFKKAHDLLDFVREGGPFSLESDIGYSINHEKNGVWLPGNYNVRKNKEHYGSNEGWGSMDDDFKEKYSVRAMNISKNQFHDAHKKYNENVLSTLEDVAHAIGEPDGTCPFCMEKYEKLEPPYGLVGRLDFISSSHRNMITNMGISKGKKYKYYNNGYFTSRFVGELFKAKKKV